MTTTPQTLLDKIWDAHVVAQEPGAPALLYIDLHLIHELTSPQAFDGLRRRGLRVRRPERTFATLDHSTPTDLLALPLHDAKADAQVKLLMKNCAEFGIKLYDLDSDQRGIVHVIGPELGLTQPGRTIVCGDSHTSTHGAFGALAFGIGTSEVEHVLASQCLLQHKPKSMAVEIDGRLQKGVTAKDIILALIAKIGAAGGAGHVIEYRGGTIRSLGMEARMTVCNMSIEAGARAGMIAPDDTTFEYLAGREFAPRAFDQAVSRWRRLKSDEEAQFDRTVSLEVSDLVPMITYGTHPGTAIPITGRVPHPQEVKDAAQRASLEKSLAYMGLRPNQPMLGQKVDVVFLGSCTNARLSDLRLAAGMLKGRKIAQGIRMIVVPGSQRVRRQAEAEGLDRIFLEAGAEWRHAGCSMCVAINEDRLAPGQYALSTSNRNFEGRQGPGGRTFLASPLTAAATALHGVITDPRTLL